jgi:hypothetical protein
VSAAIRADGRTFDGATSDLAPLKGNPELQALAENAVATHDAALPEMNKAIATAPEERKGLRNRETPNADRTMSTVKSGDRRRQPVGSIQEHPLSQDQGLVGRDAGRLDPAAN